MFTHHMHTTWACTDHVHRVQVCKVISPEIHAKIKNDAYFRMPRPHATWSWYDMRSIVFAMWLRIYGHLERWKRVPPRGAVSGNMTWESRGRGSDNISKKKTKNGRWPISRGTIGMYHTCIDAQQNSLSNGYSVNASSLTHVEVWPKECTQKWAKSVSPLQNAKNDSGSISVTAWDGVVEFYIFGITVTRTTRISYFRCGWMPRVRSRVPDVS